MEEDQAAPAAEESQSPSSVEPVSVEGDWHASVRRPLMNDGSNGHRPPKGKKKRTNRSSLDGTRRFRKVVTFRNSMVQTRTIDSRTRGRNSLLPWFSRKAQEHTQEVLEEQERQRQEKEAKKQQKKEAKVKKKEEKIQRKKEKKEAKVRKKEMAKNANNIPSGELHIFEDSGDIDKDDLDMSMSLGDGKHMGSSNNNNNRNNNINGSFVDHSRRRSSVSTAILDTMRMFTKNKKSQSPRFPKNEPRSRRRNKEKLKEKEPEEDSYDWSAHLRSSLTDTQSKATPKKQQFLLTEEKSEGELIDEEELAFERAMKTLPTSNPQSLYSNQINSDNSDKKPTNEKLNDSIMDMSGNSFADPSAPDNRYVPKNTSRKKSMLRMFSGWTDDALSSSKRTTRKSPVRKPTPHHTSAS